MSDFDLIARLSRILGVVIPSDEFPKGMQGGHVLSRLFDKVENLARSRRATFRLPYGGTVKFNGRIRVLRSDGLSTLEVEFLGGIGPNVGGSPLVSEEAPLPGRPIGKTADFGSANAGSTPARGTTPERCFKCRGTADRPGNVARTLGNVIPCGEAFHFERFFSALGAMPMLDAGAIREAGLLRAADNLRSEIATALKLLGSPAGIGLEEAVATTLAEAEDDRKAAFEAGRRAGWKDRLALSMKIGGGSTTFNVELLADESLDIRVGAPAAAGGGSSGASAVARSASGGGASSAEPQGSPGAMR